MGGLFKVSEIVQMAIDEEHNGYFFYNALADCADSDALKEVAKRLAEQERGHEKAFTALRDRLGGYQPHETYPGEYADYVAVLVGGKTFPDEEAAVKLAQEAGGDDPRARFHRGARPRGFTAPEARKRRGS